MTQVFEKAKLAAKVAYSKLPSVSKRTKRLLKYGIVGRAVLNRWDRIGERVKAGPEYAVDFGATNA
jgi:hypothetical protein